MTRTIFNPNTTFCYECTEYIVLAKTTSADNRRKKIVEICPICINIKQYEAWENADRPTLKFDLATLMNYRKRGIIYNIKDAR